MQVRNGKKVRVVNEKMLIVAIDIGKSTNYGYMRGPFGREEKPFSFTNLGEGFKRFWRKVREFQKECGLEEVVVGFESSGAYGEPLCYFLRKRGVRLVQTNPMHTKRLKELTGNSPEKSDRKDPRVIADIIMLGHALSVIIPEGASAELRQLTHARERALKDQTADKNRLHDRMYVLFPEFEKIMKGVSSKSAWYLMRKYPTPESIAAVGVERLAARLKKVSRGRLCKKRAGELVDAARKSVGVDEGIQSILLEVERLVDKIEETGRFIQKVESHMKRYLTQIPYSGSILSIKGIGVVTTAGLIGEVGDFRKYRTAREVTKLAGFDLFEVSSGKHKGQRHISKRGRSTMRRLLYFAAVNAVKSNGIMHDRYQAMLVRGMLRTKALIAIARKLLKLIYALARDNMSYVENTERSHQAKSAA